MSFLQGLFGPPDVAKMEAQSDIEGLIKALGYQKDPSVRRAGALALGKIGNARAIEPLITALKDSDSKVRQTAAETLGMIGDARAVEPLITALEDVDLDVRQSAVEALGNIGNSRAVKPLITKFSDKYGPDAAISALAKIGKPAIEPLITALKDVSKVIRQSAAKTLGMIGDPRAVEPLITALTDMYKDVRQAAVEALDQLGWNPGKDENGARYWIQKRKWNNCIDIGGPAIELLITALHDEDEGGRKGAADALGVIGDVHAMEALIPALKDKDKDVRKSAADALVKLGMPAAEVANLIPKEETPPVMLRVLEGHFSPVTALAVTSDGSRAVAGDFYGMLRVWDLASGSMLHTIETGIGAVSTVAVTPDGRSAIAKIADPSLLGVKNPLGVWDLASGKMLRILEGHTLFATSVAVTPNGQRAVSGSADKMLRVWDLASGRMLLTLAGHHEAVTAVAVTPDGLRAVSGSADKTLQVWDLASGRSLLTLTGHYKDVTSVAVTPDGTRAVSGSDDKTLRVWDLASGRTLCTLMGHDDYVTSVAVTPDGARAISASSDRTLKVWDLALGDILHTLEGHLSGVNAVSVTPDGCYAVSGSGDGTLRIWDLIPKKPPIAVPDLLNESGKAPSPQKLLDDNQLPAIPVPPVPVASTLRPQPDLPGEPKVIEETYSLMAHKKSPDHPNTAITSLVVTRDGRRAVTASWDASLKVWDLGSWELLRTLDASLPPTPTWVRGRMVDTSENMIFCVALTPDDRFAVAGSHDNLIRVWDLESGALLRMLSGHAGWVKGVAVTSDGRRVVSGAWDKTLRIWDLESGAELHKLECPSLVNAIAITPDGRLAVCAMFREPILIWDLAKREVVRTLPSENDVLAVAITTDGVGIVSGHQDGSIKLWEIASGNEVLSMVGHRNTIQDHPVAVTPDGRLAISGTDDGLFAWDLASGRQVCSFVGNLVSAVAVKPDGSTLLSAHSAFEGSVIRSYPLPELSPALVPQPLPEPVVAGTAAPAQASKDTTIRSLDEVANEIMSIDRQLNDLAMAGKGKTDTEWWEYDYRLTAIGKKLYEEGGEARMQAALQLASEKGLRGRYAERHWTGIGSWMG